MSAAPTAETRVRWCVQIWNQARQVWNHWSSWEDEQRARNDLTESEGQVVGVTKFRIVRETSVITREVLP